MPVPLARPVSLTWDDHIRLESRRSGRGTLPASPAAHESLQSVAYPGGGRPQAASECVLAQEPRSRLRSQSARHVSALCPGAPFLPTRACRDLRRRKDWDANFTTRAPYPTGATGQTGKTRARVHPPWGTRAPGLLRRPDGPTRVASWADPHQCGLGRPSHTRRAATACDAAL